MIFNKDDQKFLESLAPTETGKTLVRVLENVDAYYADIRNLEGTDAKVRVDALKILKESLIDKLKVLAGTVEPPQDNWK